MQVNNTTEADHYPLDVNDERKPWFIPLAKGWEWHVFSDGKKSTRWITTRNKKISPAQAAEMGVDGMMYRCTTCGFEVYSKFAIAGHNGGHTKNA